MVGVAIVTIPTPTLTDKDTVSFCFTNESGSWFPVINIGMFIVLVYVGLGLILESILGLSLELGIFTIPRES